MGELEKSGDRFRLLFDTKGRFVLHRVNKDEATYKLCRVQKTFITSNKIPLTKGRNVGRVGKIVHIEKHQGSFDIITVKDTKGHTFSTRLDNVFVIGDGNHPQVTMPKGRGIKKTILQERDEAVARGEL